jgi:zinc protease
MLPIVPSVASHRARALTLGCGLLIGWLGVPTPGVTGPEIQHWTTESGARVYFVSSPELPMVDLRVVFAAGSARDGDTPGLARLTNRLLSEGAADRSALELAQSLEGVGASLRSSTDRDRASLGLRSLRDPERLEPAIATFTDILTQPDFPSSAITRERARMQVALQSRDEDPGDVASDRFYAEVFGTHPYAHGPHGTREGLEAINRDAIRAFHQRYYVARNATVAIVGDLDRAEAEALAAQVTGALAAGDPAPPLPEVPDRAHGERLHLAHPSQQAHILTGQPGMRRGDPDYFDLYVGNHILGGGGFSARLMSEVREERGLAYSVYSYLQPQARRGPFVMGLQTRADQAEQALDLLLDELRAFRSEGPTAEELDDAVRNITGSFPLRIDSNRKKLNYIAMIGFYELPLTYLNDFNDRVRAVDRETIQDAFQRRIHPDRLVQVLVGPHDE